MLPYLYSHLHAPHRDVEYVGSQAIGERHVQIDLVR